MQWIRGGMLRVGLALHTIKPFDGRFKKPVTKKYQNAKNDSGMKWKDFNMRTRTVDFMISAICLQSLYFLVSRREGEAVDYWHLYLNHSSFYTVVNRKPNVTHCHARTRFEPKLEKLSAPWAPPSRAAGIRRNRQEVCSDVSASPFTGVSLSW